MSTEQSTIDYLQDQLVSVDNVSTRKMFGEYALYVGTKVVALVCDNTLFVKITDEGKEYAGTKYKEGFAYKGAKVSMQISEDLIEDRAWLSELIEITESELPEPKPKKKRVEYYCKHEGYKNSQQNSRDNYLTLKCLCFYPHTFSWYWVEDVCK